jgi:hypothetical protein
LETSKSGKRKTTDISTNVPSSSSALNNIPPPSTSTIARAQPPHPTLLTIHDAKVAQTIINDGVEARPAFKLAKYVTYTGEVSKLPSRFGIAYVYKSDTEADKKFAYCTVPIQYSKKTITILYDQSFARDESVNWNTFFENDNDASLPLGEGTADIFAKINERIIVDIFSMIIGEKPNLRVKIHKLFPEVGYIRLRSNIVTYEKLFPILHWRIRCIINKNPSLELEEGKCAVSDNEVLIGFKIPYKFQISSLQVPMASLPQTGNNAVNIQR